MTGCAVAIIELCLLLSPFAPRASAECTTVDTPCRDYARHSVVFQGRVDRITPLGRPGAYAPNLVSLTVEKTWKGLQGTTAEIFEADALDSDYHGFVVGERYVVYATRDERTGQIRASGCGRTKRLAESKRDLEFLESLSRPATGGRIFGFVFFDREGRGYQLAPLPDVLLVLRRGSLHREARSGPDGQFEFTGLEPGTYDVSIVVPAGHVVSAAEPVIAPRNSPVPSTVRVTIESDRDCTLATFLLRR